MERLVLNINDRPMTIVLACIKQIWPGEGTMAIGRFAL